EAPGTGPARRVTPGGSAWASYIPAPARATPLSGAAPFVAHELEDVARRPAERRCGIGGLVRTDEVERLCGLVHQRHQVLVAAEAPRLVAEHPVQRRLAAV